MITTDQIECVKSVKCEQNTWDKPSSTPEFWQAQPEPLGDSSIPSNVYLVEESGAPWLFLHAAKGRCCLTWISDEANQQLEVTETLLSPIPWQIVREAPIRSQRRFTVSLPPSDKPRFFRLRQINRAATSSTPSQQDDHGRFQTLLGGLWFRGTHFTPAA